MNVGGPRSPSAFLTVIVFISQTIRGEGRRAKAAIRRTTGDIRMEVD